MLTTLLARRLRQSPSLARRASRWPRALALVALLALAGSAQAQLSGAYTINPSGSGATNYTTFGAAFTALNTSGVSGSVTFTVSAATFTESNLVLNTIAGASATNTITFNGAGATSIISAAAGTSANTSTTTRDAIVVLNGTDFVKFNSLALTDPTSNSTTTTQMEYGFLMLRPSNTNGCNNNTIQNCIITLQKANNTSTSNTAIGIASLPFTTTTVGGTALSPTGASAAGQSSNNRFYGNTIQNVYTGIFLLGLSDATPYTNYDQNNDIGGIAAGTGNTIQNFGGVTAATTAIAYGVRVFYQNGFSARYNTVNNTAGGGGGGYSRDLRFVLSHRHECQRDDEQQRGDADPGCIEQHERHRVRGHGRIWQQYYVE